MIGQVSSLSLKDVMGNSIKHNWITPKQRNGKSGLMYAKINGCRAAGTQTTSELKISGEVAVQLIEKECWVWDESQIKSVYL